MSLLFLKHSLCFGVAPTRNTVDEKSCCPSMITTKKEENEGTTLHQCVHWVPHCPRQTGGGAIPAPECLGHGRPRSSTHVRQHVALFLFLLCVTKWSFLQ